MLTKHFRIFDNRPCSGTEIVIYIYFFTLMLCSGNLFKTEGIKIKTCIAFKLIDTDNDGYSGKVKQLFQDLKDYRSNVQTAQKCCSTLMKPWIESIQ
jgi:hypothetical protein